MTFVILADLDLSNIVSEEGQATPESHLNTLGASMNHSITEPSNFKSSRDTGVGDKRDHGMHDFKMRSDLNGGMRSEPEHSDPGKALPSGFRGSLFHARVWFRSLAFPARDVDETVQIPVQRLLRGLRNSAQSGLNRAQGRIDPTAHGDLRYSSVAYYFLGRTISLPLRASIPILIFKAPALHSCSTRGGPTAHDFHYT